MKRPSRHRANDVARSARTPALALAAQLVSSFANFAMAVLIGRRLGPAALGTYAVLFSYLLTVTALQTSWVGDALSVMDRSAEDVQRGLMTTQLAFTAAGGLSAVPAAVVLGRVPLATATIFGVLVTGWLMEEYVRRALMSRLRFAQLAWDDACYLYVAAAALALLGLRAAPVTVFHVVLAMALGAWAAFGAGLVFLHRSERPRLAVGRLGNLRQVAAFGSWRAAQAVVGQAAATVARVATASAASPALLGNIEAARIMVAPVHTVLGGASNFLLPFLSRSMLPPARQRRIIALTTASATGFTVLYGAVVLGFTEEAVAALVGRSLHPTRATIAGWLLGAVLVALSAPTVTYIVSVGRVQAIFWSRVVSGVLMVAGTMVVLRLDRPTAVPLAFAASTAWNSSVTWFIARRHHESSG